MLEEADPGVQDAAMPDLNAQVSRVGTQSTPDVSVASKIAPEGYVDIVRLLVRATAMTFPIGALDTLYKTPVTIENANATKVAVESACKQYELTGDNEQRTENHNIQTYIDSITMNNFIEKLKEVKHVIETPIK